MWAQWVAFQTLDWPPNKFSRALCAFKNRNRGSSFAPNDKWYIYSFLFNFAYQFPALRRCVDSFEYLVYIYTRYIHIYKYGILLVCFGHVSPLIRRISQQGWTTPTWLRLTSVLGDPGNAGDKPSEEHEQHIHLGAKQSYSWLFTAIYKRWKLAKAKARCQRQWQLESVPYHTLSTQSVIAKSRI